MPEESNMNGELKFRIDTIFHKVNHISDLLLEVSMDLAQLNKLKKEKTNDKVSTKKD